MKAIEKMGIIFAALFIGFLTNAYSQKCIKETFCPNEFYGPFDYRQQSRAAVLEPGDTASVEVVVVKGEKTRILVCGDQKLGQLHFKVFKKVKTSQKYIRKINVEEKEVPKYERDGRGEVKKDDWGDPIILGYEVVTNRDTIWAQRLVDAEVEIFDNKNNSKGLGYWQENISESGRLRVQVIVAPNNSTEIIEGCVNVQVGWVEVDEAKKTFTTDK